MSAFIDKLREELEGQEFPSTELKKAVFRLLNLKEEVSSRGLDGDPVDDDNKERPKPDGGPTEEEILSNSITIKELQEVYLA